MIKFVLYGVLGVVLGVCGINVVDEPLKFIAIMSCVVLIDVSNLIG